MVHVDGYAGVKYFTWLIDVVRVLGCYKQVDGGVD